MSSCTDLCLWALRSFININFSVAFSYLRRVAFLPSLISIRAVSQLLRRFWLSNFSVTYKMNFLESHQWSSYLYFCIIFSSIHIDWLISWERNWLHLGKGKLLIAVGIHIDKLVVRLSSSIIDSLLRTSVDNVLFAKCKIGKCAKKWWRATFHLSNRVKVLCLVMGRTPSPLIGLSQLCTFLKHGR